MMYEIYRSEIYRSDEEIADIVKLYGNYLIYGNGKDEMSKQPVSRKNKGEMA